MKRCSNCLQAEAIHFASLGIPHDPLCEACLRLQAEKVKAALIKLGFPKPKGEGLDPKLSNPAGDHRYIIAERARLKMYLVKKFPNLSENRQELRRFADEVAAVPTGIIRPPKAGEWYLGPKSFGVLDRYAGYIACSDHTEPAPIAKLVRIQMVITERVSDV